MPVAVPILPALSDWSAAVDALSIMIGGVVVAGMAVIAFSIINLGIAWRQRREGGGTWLRLAAVCLAVAVLQVLPLIVFVYVFNFGGRSMQDRIMPSGILLIWNWLLLTMSLRGPVRLAHSRDPLPLVEDERFQQRVRELASAMGLRTPVVRMVRSLSGQQQAAAFAGGLPAPSLVVTDGILQRLSPDERDAVVGHELAHLANHSLWWLTGLTPVAAIGGLLTAGFGGGWFAVLVGLALRVGLLRMVSRWFERDCDRRAARVIGFSTMASALRKIHAVHVLRNTGWRSVLVYATATHPSCIERLAALENAAPEGDRLNGESSSTDYRRRILAARIAALVWMITIVLAVAGRLIRPASVWPALLLIGVLTVPFWPLIDSWRKLRLIARRTRQRRRRKVFGRILMAIGAGAYGVAYLVAGRSVPLPSQFIVIQVLSVGCALLGLLVSVGGAPAGFQRVRQHLLKALQDHDFDAAVRIGADRERVVQRSAELTHNVAVARILSGDRERGLQELRANVDRHPLFVQSLLTLSAIQFDAGDYEAASAAAAQAADRLKHDPAPRVLRAAALWRLGRLDEAEALAGEAMALDPDSGEPHLVLAGVAIVRGDERAARQALETAERLSPGLPATRVVEAEAALKFDEPDKARDAIERARETAHSNPFAVIDGQVDRLEAELQPLLEACFVPEESTSG